MNKIFQEHFLNNPIYSEIYQNFRKTTSKKSIFKVGDSEYISKILEKHLQRNLHFRKIFCI